MGSNLDTFCARVKEDLPFLEVSRVTAREPQEEDTSHEMKIKFQGLVLSYVE